MSTFTGALWEMWFYRQLYAFLELSGSYDCVAFREGHLLWRLGRAVRKGGVCAAFSCVNTAYCSYSQKAMHSAGANSTML